MPIETMIVVSAIVAAYLVFGVGLAWASHQTSHLTRQAQQRSVESLDAQAALSVIGAVPANSNKRSLELVHN
jgi:hypothetical protein